MTTGALAVVSVTGAAVAAIQAELGRRGAQCVKTRQTRPDYVLVCGHFPDAMSVHRVVIELRRQGWAATARPTDDDPQLMAWRNRTRPIDIGDGRLMVALPWADVDRNATPVVEIDPGGAFGAGAHPSSRLLLEALAARLQGGERVLDVGCGSGVLAIAAVVLGATAAVGIDIEDAALTATHANAVRNGVKPQVMASSVPLQTLSGTFDVIVANIGRDVLIDLAPDIERRLAPGGWVGLSGISPAQVSLVAAAFSALRVVATPRLDDWAAILGLPGDK
ncbi:MAG: 50S ribosomal protein L11 methyltransferase [bacterium]|nr:50S ribosomal protein L11 methyltransferase [bacterium]